MMEKNLPALSHQVTYQAQHRVWFTRDAFHRNNDVLAKALENADLNYQGHLLVLIDQSIPRHHPKLQNRIETYLAHHAPHVHMPKLCAIRTLPGGEISKNDLSNLEWVLKLLAEYNICRRSTVLAIGGGAILDCVGLAASIFHRSVNLVRMPTTTLSQDDSGVGVKSAVNMFGQKNLVGAFGVPKGVVNDFALLDSLPTQDFLAGFSEAVKVALLKDATFYAWLRTHAKDIAQRDSEICDEAIYRSAKLHMEHICLGGDPFENLAARPLDFGHWSAHQLEHMTQHHISHGEAVGIGVALDMVWSALTGHCNLDFAKEVCQCLADMHIPIYHPILSDIENLLEGAENFREHLGGELTITIPAAPGNPIDHHVLPRAHIVKAINILEQWCQTNAWPHFNNAHHVITAPNQCLYSY